MPDDRTDVVLAHHDDFDSLFFSAHDTGVEEAVLATGHEPDGHFWEAVTAHLIRARKLRIDVDFHCEEDMFSVHGEPEHLAILHDQLLPYLDDPVAVTALIAQAERAGAFRRLSVRG